MSLTAVPARRIFFHKQPLIARSEVVLEHESGPAPR
jgi:hypothetical protein